MLVETSDRQKLSTLIPSSTVVLLTFALAFFPRLLTNAGLPDILNFAHFALVPVTCIWVLGQSRIRNRLQITAVQAVIWGIMALLCVMLASAILNNAGAVNVVLNFLLLVEPFILLLALLSLSLSAKRCQFLSNWLLRFGFFHVGLAYVQLYVLRYDLKDTGLVSWDNIQGVFFLSPGAPPVAVGVSILTGLYFLLSRKNFPLWLRVLVFCACCWHLVMAEAKQVLLFFTTAWVLLFFTKVHIDFKKALLYFCGIASVAYPLVWAIYNLEIFASFQNWINRSELFGSDGEATHLKTIAFQLVPQYYTSALHWFLGLGPGHTVGRLGGGMLEKYWHLLEPLGATIHPVSRAIKEVADDSWLIGGSNLIKPDFSWAGIWGDLGLIGIAAYLLAWWLVWQAVCRDDFSRFLVLGILPLGFAQAMLEQPGYMLFMVMLLGIRWHESRLQVK